MVLVKYQEKRRAVNGLEEQLQQLEDTLSSSVEEEGLKQNQVRTLEQKLRELSLELEEQQRKLDRAQKHCQRLAKDWRASQNAPLDSQTPEEVDIDVKSAKDFNRLLLQKLADVAARQPEIEERFHQLCQDAQIPAPSRPVSTAPSRVVSRQSAYRSSISTPTSSGRQSATGTPLPSKAVNFPPIQTTSVAGFPKFPSRKNSATSQEKLKQGSSRDLNQIAAAITGRAMTPQSSKPSSAKTRK